MGSKLQLNIQVCTCNKVCVYQGSVQGFLIIKLSELYTKIEDTYRRFSMFTNNKKQSQNLTRYQLCGSVADLLSVGVHCFLEQEILKIPVGICYRLQEPYVLWTIHSSNSHCSVLKTSHLCLDLF